MSRKANGVSDSPNPDPGNKQQADAPASAAPTRNRFDRQEWAGAFGDIGTLIPFVLGYITILNMDPSGILLGFGVFLIVSGLFYRTPFPVQPMKAIGTAAIAQTTLISANMVWCAGLFTGLFWLILGLSGALKYVAKIVSKPVVLGLILGLGISLMLQGITFITSDIPIALIALALTLLLLQNKRIPALLILLLFGIAVMLITNPSLLQDLASVRLEFRLPQFALGSITWQDVGAGIVLLALPQIPLTLSNAVISMTAENNRLFPDRPVTEKKVSIFQGIMNLIAPIFGGVPMCHGVGGMAAQVRFGARTGGAIIIFGAFLLFLGLFFSDSVSLLLGMIPSSVLGVIILFAGLELSLSAREIGSDKKDFYIMLFTVAFSLWNVGIGFIAGLVIQVLVKRNWLKV